MNMPQAKANLHNPLTQAKQKSLNPIFSRQ